MNKFFTIILLLLVSNPAVSQNVFPANGKVGVGTSSPSEDLTVDGSFGTSGYKIFSSSNSTTGAGIGNGFITKLNDEHSFNLSTGWRYKIILITKLTGTDSGSSYLVYYDETNQVWVKRVISASGTGSNHPLLDIANGGQIKVYTNHPNGYAIGYTIESIKVTEPDATPHIFGGDYQWQRFGNDLVFNDGKVGIGTTPESLLHISAGTEGDAVLTLQADTDNSSNGENDNPRIDFFQDGEINSSSIGHGITGLAVNPNVLEIANSTPLGGILLSVGQNSHAPNADNIGLHINHDGNIGIGKVSSSEFLDISGGVKINSKNPSVYEKNIGLGNFKNSATSTLELYSKDDGGHGHIKYFGRRWGINHYWTRGSDTGERTIAYLGGTNGGTTFSIFNPDSVRSINLASNNNSYVNTPFNFGLGTFSPTAKLDVVGGLSGVDIARFTREDSGSPYVSINAGNGDPNIRFFEKKDSGERFTFGIDNSNNSLTISQGTTLGENDLLVFRNGQLGIKANPESDFALTVKGKTLTEKVIVRNESNWNWPDFVFNENYALPSLLNVEQFIKSNKHLPGIPTVLEIEESGQDLAEMNRLLLQKVEELTLYIIDQEKRISDLEKK